MLLSYRIDCANIMQGMEKMIMTVLTHLKTVFTTLGLTPPQHQNRPFDRRQKRFAPCPASPNCVSTQAPSEDKVHYMAPIPYIGSATPIHKRLLRIIEAMPRCTVTINTPDYMRAEFRSQLFHFVDDVEFYLDEMQQIIHFRSAARSGRSDLGVNRRRMKTIWQRLGEEE